MNTLFASLSLVLFFTVNGMTMDGDCRTTPLVLLKGEIGERTVNPSSAGGNRPYTRSIEMGEGVQPTEQRNVSGAISSACDATLSNTQTSNSDSSSIHQNQDIGAAKQAFEDAFASYHEKCNRFSEETIDRFASGNFSLEPSTIGTETDGAKALCEQLLKELNDLEAKANMPLTQMPSDLTTPATRYQSLETSPFSSSTVTHNYSSTPGVENRIQPFSPIDGHGQQFFRQTGVSGNNDRGHFLTPEHRPRSLSPQISPEHFRPITTTATSPSRPSRQKPNFYDSGNSVKWIPTIFADTPVSAAAVDYFFNIDPRYGIPAWFFGNVFGSIVASHYLIRAIEAHSPEPAKSFFKELLAPSEPLNYVWNPGYFVYYTTAWSIMGMDKTFNVTPLQAASFMLLSGAIRQIADQVINKKNCFSWNTKTWRPEVRNPFSWNPKNINAIASSPRSQHWRAFWEYLPDIIGAAARSGSSNIPGYWQGTETVNIIIPKVLKSTAVYTGGLAAYYGLYRGIELSHASHYKEASEMNQRMLKRLYHNIQRAARHGIALDSEGHNLGGLINTPSDEELNPLLAGTNNANRTSTSTTPTRNFSRSSSSKKLIDHPISREALLASLKVLRSHLISYFKDPIFYRLENPWKAAPAPFRQAYSIIDLLEMYKSHVTDAKTTADQIGQASHTLLATLKNIRLTPQEVDKLILRKVPQHDNPESQLSPYHNRRSIPFHDILPLLYLFDRYAGTHPDDHTQPSNRQAAEQTPLRGSQHGNGYGATDLENGNRGPTEDDLFSDDSDLDDGWAPR